VQSSSSETPGASASEGRRNHDEPKPRAGKRLSVELRLSDDKRHRHGAPALDASAEADVDMQCAGSSVTASDAALSLESKAAEAGVHTSLGRAASEGVWTRGAQSLEEGGTIAGETALNDRTSLEGGRAGLEEQLRIVQAENRALREEVYGMVGAHVRAEQAGKLYLRAVGMLAKLMVQAEERERLKVRV
jgi:hypothetical protein